MLDCCAGADPEYRLPIRVINEYAWHNLFARNLFIIDPRSLLPHAPEFTVIDSPSFKADPAAPRDKRRSRHRGQFREEAGADRRNQLCRRDEEVDFQRAQLPAAAAGRAVDALLGQRRSIGRRGALFRAVGHWQDHALERSRAPADRRR